MTMTTDITEAVAAAQAAADEWNAYEVIEALEEGDDARYWLTVRGLAALEVVAPDPFRRGGAPAGRDPDAIVAWFPAWEAWDVIDGVEWGGR